jgi:UDP-N-acetylmuramoyl-L-alanyl-D-glutamate--2,6-diaminopimelate ligase
MLESPQVQAPDDPSGGSFVSGRGASTLATDASPATRGKSLAQLLAAMPDARVHGDPSVLVADVVHRSSDATAGSLFFCVPGIRVDGHDFAPQAVAAGATVVVGERLLDLPSVRVVVPSVRRAMGPASAVFFGHPSDHLSLIGVTGTNGKTTTTYLLESIFRAWGKAPGVIGTTGVRIAGRSIPFDRTTPEAPDLHRLLAQMVQAGVQAAAMEVSSHGLHQHRVDGVRYACAVFTNLSQDHLDYHGTLEEYFRAKARLFTPELSRSAAINHDSPEGRRLVEVATIPTTTFGLEPGANVVATDVEVSASGITFICNGRRFASPLRGTFNVYNCLGAIASARVVGVEDEAIAQGLASLGGVPGRLEPVEVGQDFMVLVDYAHTPDSLENVLRATRELAHKGRLIVVFGCGGDRDRGKRPLMGEVATRLADLAILTSDNPRSEEPRSIIDEIEAGARRGGGPFSVEPDRRAAIRSALVEAGPGDLVLISGKGHETGQEFRDRVVPFDDRVVASEELAALLEMDR